MKKSQASSDTEPKAEPQPRPECAYCGFPDPVGGVNARKMCCLCDALIAEHQDTTPMLIAIAFVGNRIRRDIFSGHES